MGCQWKDGFGLKFELFLILFLGWDYRIWIEF
jgi:hypothetical protein